MAKKEITFEEICRDITARKFQPVYVLMGEEPFFIDQITDLLLFKGSIGIRIDDRTWFTGNLSSKGLSFGDEKLSSDESF
jgi:DNA polymerase III delta subunit